MARPPWLALTKTRQGPTVPLGGPPPLICKRRWCKTAQFRLTFPLGHALRRFFIEQARLAGRATLITTGFHGHDKTLLGGTDFEHHARPDLTRRLDHIAADPDLAALHGGLGQ